MRKVIAIVAGVLILAVVNVVVVQREQLLASGTTVFLELAPVDPRSLMQGDYMRLEFRAARDAGNATHSSQTADGYLVLALDERSIGRFVRYDDGAPLREREVRLRFRMRDKRVKLVTNAWFFEEGQAKTFAEARYGEFRVAPGGNALLAKMRDEKLQPIESVAPR